MRGIYRLDDTFYRSKKGEAMNGNDIGQIAEVCAGVIILLYTAAYIW